MSELVVGVDGGGTRTRVLVLDGDGQLVARGEGPPSLARAGDPEPAARAVARAVDGALRAAGRTDPVGPLWAALAGVGSDVVRQAVELALVAQDCARVVRVGTDLGAAYHDAFQEHPGILMVAGTGSSALGRSEDGRELQVGGWGGLLGDEGGGFWIAVRGLRAAVRAFDGRGPETALVETLLQATGVPSPRDLVTWAEGAAKDRIASLAPRVLELADDGDEVSLGIAGEACLELGAHLARLLEELAPWAEPPSVALAGGLMDPGSRLRRRMEAVVRGHELSPLAAEVDGARGAARLASTL